MISRPGSDEQATLDRGDQGVPVEGTAFRVPGALSHGLDFGEEVTSPRLDSADIAGGLNVEDRGKKMEETESHLGTPEIITSGRKACLSRLSLPLVINALDGQGRWLGVVGKKGEEGYMTTCNEKGDKHTQ